MISTHDHNVNSCKSCDVSNVSNYYKCSYVGVMKSLYDFVFIFIKEISLKIRLIKPLQKVV